MPDMSAPLKLGVNCWNQYSEWDAFLAAHRRADRLGFDSIWTWDHVYPIVGSHDGPIFEGYTAMSAVATMTERASVGLLVGANTFRNPALVAKMVTTMDHISDGRAVLGIGAAWMEPEHTAFGFEFGDRPGTRLRWLREALPILRGMLAGERPSVDGERYHTREVLNLPAPLQERIPILIGGSGPKVTLRLVAEYADMNNIGRSPDTFREKDATLVAHCEAIGRDERTIERTMGVGTPFIRDTQEEAFTVMADVFADNGAAKTWTGMPVGTVDDVVEAVKPYLDAGYHHLIFGIPAPYDEETMTRLATEVRPQLEAYLADRS